MAVTNGMKIEGHLGTWYILDSKEVTDGQYYLMESEQHGEDAAHIIIDDNGKIIMDDVFNGWADLEDTN
jgi:hypothetical protein